MTFVHPFVSFAVKKFNAENAKYPAKDTKCSGKLTCYLADTLLDSRVSAFLFSFRIDNVQPVRLYSVLI